MRLGTAIVLLALGAILTFATDVTVSGLDLDVVGWILMLVGVVGFVLTLVVWMPRRRVARTAVAPVEVVEEHRVAPRRQVVEERRMYEDPPL